MAPTRVPHREAYISDFYSDFVSAPAAAAPGLRLRVVELVPVTREPGDSYA